MSTSSGEKFVLAVPTLNEAGNIERLLKEVQRVLDPLERPYEIVVVDDGSEDGTPDIVLRSAEIDPRVRLLSRREQRGLAGAVLHGWSHSSGELLGVIDADLQHPPDILPRLLKAIDNGADIAIASRYVTKDGVDGWNPFRVAISRASTWATVPLQRKGLRIKDPMSGFFVVRREAVDGIEFNRDPDASVATVRGQLGPDQVSELGPTRAVISSVAALPVVAGRIAEGPPIGQVNQAMGANLTGG